MNPSFKSGVVTDTAMVTDIMAGTAIVVITMDGTLAEAIGDTAIERTFRSTRKLKAAGDLLRRL